MSDFLNWELTNRMYNLGYDGKTLMYIDDEEDIINDDSAELIGAKPAILTSAAFRWFSEKHRLSHYNIRRDYNISEDGVRSYDDIELECLKKLIEIVKEKK